MKINSPKNENYSATITRLKEFVTLPNCDNVKSAIIYGNSVIVSVTAKEGDLGLFFPVETQLSKKFLSANNLYRHAQWGNIDQTKTGFFEQAGRVKAMKFRGHKSEGFWLSISCLDFLQIDITQFNVGDTFDELNGISICTKYIPKTTAQGVPKTTAQGVPNSRKKITDNVLEGQFRFHYDTGNLKRNIFKIQPTDIISISDKWHGTSAIVGKVLTKRNLSWFEKLLKKLNIKISETEYQTMYSSRRVIKGIGKFGKDVYGTVASEVSDKIPNGYTLYGEIVGYLPNGGHIQKGLGGKIYHYSCQPGEHKFVVYRIVNTNIDGKTLELSWPQMKEFCNKYGLEMVKELFYGPVTEICSFDPMLQTISEWQETLLKTIVFFYATETNCLYCNFEVPSEGVVVRIDHLNECESWKIKNFGFLELETKMNDTGEVDIETAESEEN